MFARLGLNGTSLAIGATGWWTLSTAKFFQKFFRARQRRRKRKTNDNQLVSLVSPDLKRVSNEALSNSGRQTEKPGYLIKDVDYENETSPHGYSDHGLCFAALDFR